MNCLSGPRNVSINLQPQKLHRRSSNKKRCPLWKDIQDPFKSLQTNLKTGVDFDLSEGQHYINHLLKLIFCSVIEEINRKPRNKVTILQF